MFSRQLCNVDNSTYYAQVNFLRVLSSSSLTERLNAVQFAKAADRAEQSVGFVVRLLEKPCSLNEFPFELQSVKTFSDVIKTSIGRRTSIKVDSRYILQQLVRLVAFSYTRARRHRSTEHASRRRRRGLIVKNTIIQSPLGPRRNVPQARQPVNLVVDPRLLCYCESGVGVFVSAAPLPTASGMLVSSRITVPVPLAGRRSDARLPHCCRERPMNGRDTHTDVRPSSYRFSRVLSSAEPLTRLPRSFDRHDTRPAGVRLQRQDWPQLAGPPACLDRRSDRRPPTASDRRPAVS